MSKELFIKTQDENTAKQLEVMGYNLITKNGSMWVFANDAQSNERVKVFLEKNTIIMDNKLFV